MIYILLVLTICLFLTVLLLWVQNSKIKRVHITNINKLEAIITSLHSKQLELNQKVTISSEYNSNYTKDMKTLGDEVVALQKIFIEIISNKN